MSITTINNATAAVPQTQVPQTADGDAAIQGDATGKIEAGDAPIIQGAGLVITEAVLVDGVFESHAVAKAFGEELLGFGFDELVLQ